MLVCGVCKGKKLIKDPSGKNVLCPKCNGSGKLEESKNNKEDKKRVLNG